MKLTKRLIKRKRTEMICSSGKISAGADRRISTNDIDGASQSSIVAPFGLICIPASNADGVVVPTSAGSMCIGMRIPYNNFDLQPGEVMLYSSGGATLVLKNDGKIYANGRELT